MDKHENRYWAILFLLIGMLGALLNDIGGYNTTSIVMMCVGFPFALCIIIMSYLNGNL